MNNLDGSRTQNFDYDSLNDQGPIHLPPAGGARFGVLCEPRLNLGGPSLRFLQGWAFPFLYFGSHRGRTDEGANVVPAKVSDGNVVIDNPDLDYRGGCVTRVSAGATVEQLSKHLGRKSY